VTNSVFGKLFAQKESVSASSAPAESPSVSAAGTEAERLFELAQNADNEADGMAALKKAADAGHPEGEYLYACYVLENLHDKNEARKYLTQAVNAGYPDTYGLKAHL
jgi:hypothetical protein